MPRSNFSTFKDGVTVGGVGLDVYSHGTHYYVCNGTVLTPKGLGGSDGNDGLTADRPLSTLAAAVAKCTASRGDVIVLMPGHSETISTATALNLSIAGVTIVGVGDGSSIPNITLDTLTTSTITVSAANVTIRNVQFTPNFADIVTLFTLTTAKNFRLEQCRVNTGTSVNFIAVVTTSATTANNDGLHIESCYWAEPAVTAVSLVSALGTQDRVTVSNNYVNLGVNNSKPCLITQAAGKIITNLRCSTNKLYRLNTTNAGMVLTTNQSTNTGIIDNNYCQAADGTNNLIATASSGYGFFSNSYSGVAGASGFLNPTADS